MALPLSPIGPETTALLSPLYWGPSGVLPGGHCLMPPPSLTHPMYLGKYGPCAPATAHRAPGLLCTVLSPSPDITGRRVPAHAHACLPTLCQQPPAPRRRHRATRPTLASPTCSGLGAQRSGSLPEHQHQEPELAPHGGRQDPTPGRYCAGPGERGGPGSAAQSGGWQAEGWVARRRRSAGPGEAAGAASARAGRERAERRRPGAGTGRGRGRGRGAAGALPSLPLPSPPSPGALRELPQPLPRRRRKESRELELGYRAGNLWT